jgi:hypothetical protein
MLATLILFRFCMLAVSLMQPLFIANRKRKQHGVVTRVCEVEYGVKSYLNMCKTAHKICVSMQRTCELSCQYMSFFSFRRAHTSRHITMVIGGSHMLLNFMAIA